MRRAQNRERSAAAKIGGPRLPSPGSGQRGRLSGEPSGTPEDPWVDSGLRWHLVSGGHSLTGLV